MEMLKKKTKIVATLGPSSDTYDRILALYKAGANIFRINMSHGNHNSHKVKIDLIKKIEKDLNTHIGVMLDTKGPEIRTGLMKDGKVEIHKDQTIIVSMIPCEGTSEKISVSYPDLYLDVRVGDSLKIDDGNLELKINEIKTEEKELVCVAQNGHVLKSRKGVNAPFARLTMPFISDTDLLDLQFACENGCNMLATSFTRRREDVEAVREILIKHNRPDIAIIAKIENPEGILELDNIIAAADGIMVARGDLGVEVPLELVPLHQRDIIKKCRIAGKPVITATQMLDSMVTHPRPTRAEVSDVSTAVLESTDCVMLSAESAAGLYPVESVEMQCRISNTMERELDYEALSREAYETSNKNNNDAIANSIANTAKLIDAKLIISFTETGNSTFRISKARPICPIISITNKIHTVYKSTLYWGVYNAYITTKMPAFIEEMEVLSLKIAHDLKLPPGTPIIMSGGTPTGSGRTNFMRIIHVNKIRVSE